jgi:uracil-DNA glycosylase family 4
LLLRGSAIETVRVRRAVPRKSQTRGWTEPIGASGSEELAFTMKPHLVERFPGLAALEIIYEDHARDCERCLLHRHRKQVVFGIGPSEGPKIALVGPGPSPDDDEAGEPFTGDLGDLLDRILDKGLGTCRENVYLCHATCCAPKPGNRITPVHFEACRPVLLGQLRAVLPSVVIGLGKAAGRALTGVSDPELGVWYNLSNGESKRDVQIPVIVTHALSEMWTYPKWDRAVLGDVLAARVARQEECHGHCQVVRSKLDGF